MVGTFLAPDAASPLSGAAAAVVAWRSSGQLNVTVIVKATFAFAPDAEMPRVAPEPIVAGEVHHGNDPLGSVQLTSDLAPYLGRADVLFTGSGHAPAGAIVPTLRPRLGLWRAEGAVIDKTLVLNDARGFQRMPIRYEHAFGGPAIAENPIGVGAGGDARAPMIVDPADPQRPAGFGPISRAWPARKRRLGALQRSVIDAAIAEIPTPFDWSYFQAAPLDQRVDFLRGDEWILLEALHPTLPLLKTRLPRVRGAARVYGLSAAGVVEGETLDLHADTLRIDGDAELVTLVCRRSFPVPSEAALATIRIVAGIEAQGEALVWPDLASIPRTNGVVSAALAPRPSPAGTLALEDAGLGAGERTIGIDLGAGLKPAVPFRPLSTGAGAQPSRAGVATPSARAPRIGEGTIQVTPELMAAMAREPALPFQPATGSEGGRVEPTHRKPGEQPVREESGTIALSFVAESVAANKVATPFRAPREAVPIPAASAIEAPWLEESAPVSEEARYLPKRAADLETVPYFTAAPVAEVTAAAPAPLPAAKAPSPAEFPMERCAAIAAEIAEQRSPLTQVLEANELSEARWGAIEGHWAKVVKDDGAHGRGKLRAAYDLAYVATVEKLRGAITPGEYARLVVAVERKRSDDVLGQLRIQRPALMRILRIWTKKVAGDARLGGEVAAALAALREE